MVVKHKPTCCKLLFRQLSGVNQTMQRAEAGSIFWGLPQDVHSEKSACGPSAFWRRERPSKADHTTASC
jgi:hypothetical protein